MRAFGLLRYLAAFVLMIGIAFVSGPVEARPLFPHPAAGIDGIGHYGVAADDFNNDEHLDVVVVESQGAIFVYFGDGAGNLTLETETQSPSSNSFIYAVTHDFNGDGNVDLAVAKSFNEEGGRGIGVFLGNGDGTFFSEALYGSRRTYGVGVGNFNGDAHADLVGGGSGLFVVFGDGNGTFGPPVTLSNDSTAYHLTAADFNGDGLDDIAVPDDDDDVARVWLSEGDETFTNSATLPVGDRPVGIAAGDLDGDEIPDLVTTNIDSNDVSILFGVGDGTFGPEERHPVNPAYPVDPSSVAITDLDGDGLTDLLVSNSMGFGWQAPSLTQFFGTGGGQLGPAIGLDGGWGLSFQTTLADLDGDGVDDLIRASTGLYQLHWMFGDGAGSFIDGVSVNSTHVYGSSISVGDLNGDGRTDLVQANRDSEDLTVLLADGAASFAPAQLSCVVAAAPPCPGGSDPAALVLGRLTADAHPDVAVANAASDSISILAGDGAGAFSFVSALGLPGGTSPSSIDTGDLNDDGNEDLVAVGQGSGQVAVFLGNGDGTFAAPPGPPTQAGLQPTSVAIGDLDGNADLDLVVTTRFLNRVTVLLGNGDGTFAAAPVLIGGSQPDEVAIGDLNGDTFSDLAIANGGSLDISVFLGNGDGTFGAAPVVPESGFHLHIVDLDGNGHPDLVATTYGETRMMRGNGDGTFETAERFSTITDNISDFAVGDFDLNGRLDLALTGVAVLLNQSGPSAFTFLEDGETLAWPAAVGAISYDVYRGDLSALTDVSGDGLPDNGYGVCMSALDDDTRDTFFVDFDTPSPAGAGFFYLRSVIDAQGDGGLGTTSAGLTRSPQTPCP